MKIEREWRPVVGYEGLYEVSNYGEVRKADGTPMKGNINSYGYHVVSLTKNRKKKDKKVHRLVAEAFISNDFCKRTVNHKDGDRANNHVENLEWATQQEQMKHAATLPPSPVLRGTSVIQSTLDGKIVAVWANSNIAATTLGLSQMMISACCQGTAQTAYNYRWSYAGDMAEKLLKANQLSTIRAKLEELKGEADRIERELAG